LLIVFNLEVSKPHVFFRQEKIRALASAARRSRASGAPGLRGLQQLTRRRAKAGRGAGPSKASGESGKLNKAEREELRFQWTRLSTEGRTVERGLDAFASRKLRAENAGLSQEQRIDKIRKKLERLRREREKSIRDAKAEAGRLLLSEEEVKKLVKQSLDIFQNELSAKERAELDPLVHEYIMQLNGVFQ
jgi:hypothetical protein